MGCAEGDFLPSDSFEEFSIRVLPQLQEDKDYRIWNGLSLIMSDGRRVQCVDTILHLVDFGDHVEMFVDALGVHEPPYEDLFPQHVAAYENQFKD
ncbi:hypothetical protein shim_01360 [Shimia sp. SK013]|nr:hypothetical protein shim_01360 [Shimia sp. SK013]